MKKKLKSDYSKALDFLKNNAFIVSASTAFIYAITYIYQLLLFRKWQIPPGFIDQVWPQFFFITIFGLIFCTSISVHQLFLLNKSKQIIPTYFANSFIQKFLRKSKKLAKPDKEQAELYDIVINECKIVKRKTLRLFFTTISLSILIFFPFYLLFYITVFDYSLLAIFVSFLIYLLFSFLIIPLSSSKGAREFLHEKKIRLKSNLDASKIIHACQDVARKEEQRLKKQIEASNNSRLTKITRIIAPTIITFLTMLAAKYLQALPTNYWTFTYDNKDYAIVCQFGHSTISKRIEVDDYNNLTILLDEQIYIDITSFNLRHQKFNSVHTKTNILQ